MSKKETGAKPKGRHGGRRKGAGRKRQLVDATRLAVSVPGADMKRLRGLADDEGETFTTYVRRVLREHIDKVDRGAMG